MDLEEIEAHEFLLSDPVDGVGVRVGKNIAKKWMAQNKGIICGGLLFFLNIKSMGFGIYKITKAPLTQRETKIVK
jgi:hypothetical protein